MITTNLKNPVMELLRSREQSQVLPASKFLSFTAADAAAEVKAVVAPHPYRWIALDPGAGCILRVSLDGPIGRGSETFYLHPGSWAPIGGRTCYVTWFARNKGGESPDADDASSFFLWLTAEPTPAPLRANGLLQDIQGPITGRATAPSAVTHGTRILSGYNYMTVHFTTDALARLPAGDDGIVQVWFWNNQSNLWMHNQADDFEDVNGRGLLHENHDWEVYHLPHNASRVCFVVPGEADWATTNIRAHLIFSKDQEG